MTSRTFSIPLHRADAPARLPGAPVGRWSPGRPGTAGIGLLLLVAFAACSGKSANLVARMDQRDAKIRAEIEALNNSLTSTYDRESAITERLLQVEKTNLQLRHDLEQLRQQVLALMEELEARAAATVVITPPKPVGAPGVYEDARADYLDYNYAKALEKFVQVIKMAPLGELADNAQYWIGECHYGMGAWDPAVTQFIKVFAYPNTAKADDAQLMIARCYMNLGNGPRALNAYQRLVDEYPDSEYVEAARKEMRVLQ